MAKTLDFDESTLKLWEYKDKYLEILTTVGKKYRGFGKYFFSRLDNDSNEDEIALKINYIDHRIDINAEKYTLWTNYDCFCFGLSEIDNITIIDDIPYIKYLAEFVTIHTSNGVYTGFVSDIKKHEDFYELSIKIYYTDEKYKLDSGKISNIWWDTYQINTKDIKEIELEKHIFIENTPPINLKRFVNHEVEITTLIGNKYTGYVMDVEETKKYDNEILKMDVADFNVNLNEAADAIEFDAISKAVIFFKSAINSIEIVDNPKLDDYVGKYVELTTQSYTRFKGRVNAVQYDKDEACILLEVNDVHEWLTTDTKVAFESECTSQLYSFKESEILSIQEVE